MPSGIARTEEDMKRVLSDFTLAVFGCFVGNAFYVNTIGDPNDYHLVRTVCFAVFFGTALFLLRKYVRPVS
jgi:uncharacterized membrane protein